MSWQEYVDKSLVGSGHIDKASIFGATGDSTWATTADFTVAADELKKIVSILDGDAGALETAYSEGIHVAGERYVLTRHEDKRSIYGRHVKEGICIVKTTQALIVGHYGENVQAGNATQTVEALADYLIGQGY